MVWSSKCYELCYSSSQINQAQHGLLSMRCADELPLEVVVEITGAAAVEV